LDIFDTVLLIDLFKRLCDLVFSVKAVKNWDCFVAFGRSHALLRRILKSYESAERNNIDAIEKRFFGCEPFELVSEANKMRP